MYRHSKMRQLPKDGIYGDKYLVIQEIWPPIKEEEEKEQQEEERSMTLSRNVIRGKIITKNGWGPQIVHDTRKWKSGNDHSRATQHRHANPKRESRNDDALVVERRDYRAKRHGVQLRTKAKKQGVQFKSQKLMYFYSPDEDFDDVIIVEKHDRDEPYHCRIC